MNIFLCTIPGTGTYFFRDLLEKHGCSVKALHCSKEGMVRAKEYVEKGYVLVTAWRDVEETKNNWVLMNRSLDEYDLYYRNWHQLFEYEPVVVSFSNNREARLELLGAVIGKKLETDWTPVNQHPKETGGIK